MVDRRAGRRRQPHRQTGKDQRLCTALNSEKWVGTGLPKYTGGFSTRLNYKGFDLSVLFNYALGGKYYDNNYSSLMAGTYNGFGYQMSTDELQRCKRPAISPTFPN